MSVDLNDIHAPWNEVGWDDKAARDTETVEDKIMVELLGQGCVIGPKRISELTGISTSTINKELRRMTDKGLITQTSRGAYGIPELLGQSGKVAEDTPILATLPLSSPVENSHTNSGKPICPMCQRCACALGQQRELLLYYPPSLNSRCDAQGDDEMRDIDRLFRFYKLSDPLDGDIRYIGVTARSLDERIREHIRDTKGSRGQSLLYRRNIFTWIDELLLDDRTPSIIQLEELRTIENRALYREKQWIYHHARLGYQLLNVSHSGGYYYLLRLTEGTEDNLIEYKTFKCIEWVIKKLHYYHFSSHDRRRYLRTEIMSYMRRAGLSQEICNRVSSSMSYMDHGGQSGGFKYQGEDK